MSILRNLIGERRSLTPNQAWARDLEWAGTTDAGARVSQKSATSVTAVYACVSLISDTISTLPVAPYYRFDGERRPAARPGWLDEPVMGDPSVTRNVHFSQVVTSLLLDGNAFILALPDVMAPTSLHVLNPGVIELKGREGAVTYRDTSAGVDYGPDNIIHVSRLRRPGSLRGMSPIDENRQAIGLAMAAAKSAGRFFANGTVLSGVIEVPGEMGAEEAKTLLEGFEKAHTADKAYRAGVLTGGAKWTPLSLSPENLQLLDSRGYSVGEIARLYRVPPVLLSVNEPGAVSYASAEVAVVSFEKWTIRPLVELIESAYNRLLPGEGTFLKFNTAALLRGDPKSRMEAYEIGLRNGFYSINDVRRLEDDTPVPGGDVYRVQMQMTDINAPAPTTPGAGQ